jgi:hypothetical protein
MKCSTAYSPRSRISDGSLKQSVESSGKEATSPEFGFTKFPMSLIGALLGYNFGKAIECWVKRFQPYECSAERLCKDVLFKKLR